MYILDSYGHSIINERIIDYAPSLLFAYGMYVETYLIIAVSRDGDIAIYLQKDTDSPSETIKMSDRVVSGSLAFPDFAVSTNDQTITWFVLSKSTFTIATKKYTMKLNKQPMKVEVIAIKSTKLLLVAFDT